MSDARAADRLDHRLPVKFAAGQGGTAFAFSANISPGGVFVITSTPVNEGTRVLLELNIPNGTLRVLGTAVWHRLTKSKAEAPSGFGVRLDNPPELWREFVAQLATSA